MPQPLFDNLADVFPDSRIGARHRKSMQRLPIIVVLFTLIAGLLAAYLVLTSRPVVHAASNVLLRINAGGPAIAPFVADTDFVG